MIRCVYGVGFRLRSARQAIRDCMLSSGDMNELEVEEEYARDSAVDSRVGLDVWVGEHSFNVLSIRFYV